MALRLASHGDLKASWPGGKGARTPAELRELEGTTARRGNNSGAETRVHKLPPIGPPPSRWSDERKAIWRELRSEIPWLRKPDRAALRGLVLAEEGLRAADDAGDTDRVFKYLPIILRYAQRLGATPADRTRIFLGYNSDNPVGP